VSVVAGNHVGACHCNMCRKWTGGPEFAIECESENTRFEGEDNITVYNSSEWAERGFCKRCGSNLFYRLKETGLYAIPPGLFDDDDLEDLVLAEQVFIDEKPAFYTFAEKTRELTGAEVLALYADSGQKD